MNGNTHVLMCTIVDGGARELLPLGSTVLARRARVLCVVDLFCNPSSENVVYVMFTHALPVCADSAGNQIRFDKLAPSLQRRSCEARSFRSWCCFSCLLRSFQISDGLACGTSQANRLAVGVSRLVLRDSSIPPMPRGAVGIYLPACTIAAIHTQQ